MVGYRGGHVEKDLLTKLNIPSLNLETLACPKYDVLRCQIPINSLLPSSGFHHDVNSHLCPVTECHTFCGINVMAPKKDMRPCSGQ